MTDKKESAPEDGEAKATAKPKKEPAKKAPKMYKVAEGKAITTKQGIKGAGEIICADMINGGDEVMQQLAKKGFLK
jgi:hypothetical protein